MRMYLTGLCVLLCCSSAAHSQQIDQVRSQSVVTPEGLFTVHSTGRGSTVPSDSTPAWSPSNPTPDKLRWIYPKPPAKPWSSTSVSIGNHGTLDWLGQNWDGQRLTLMAPSETSSARPWKRSESVMTAAAWRWATLMSTVTLR